jgi:HlyD family secretion protein
MKPSTLIPLVIVVAAFIAATLYFEVFRKAGPDQRKVEGSGTVEVTEIEISTKIAGRIAEIPYGEGTDVKKNDLIVKLDYEELDAQKNSALANFLNTDRNLKRVRTLFRSGSVSKNDLDNAETANKIARAALDLANASVNNALLFAPIDGTVLEKNLEAGETAFPGSVILTMADLTRPWMKVYVSEERLGLIKLGQKARVTVDTFPGKNFEGRVISIANKAEFTPKTIQTRDERVKLMYAVKIEMDNAAMELKPGMPADAVILAGTDDAKTNK